MRDQPKARVKGPKSRIDLRIIKVLLAEDSRAVAMEVGIR